MHFSNFKSNFNLQVALQLQFVGLVWGLAAA